MRGMKKKAGQGTFRPRGGGEGYFYRWFKYEARTKPQFRKGAFKKEAEYLTGRSAF